MSMSRWFSLPRKRSSRLRCASTKGPVDEQVHLGQQGVDGGVVLFQQLLVGPAGVAGHVLARAVDQPASSAKASAWQKGSPPLKVTPFKMGSFWKSANSSWGVVFLAALKGPGLGVVAARAVMGAALGEHSGSGCPAHPQWIL